jgi:hypothetical protein
MTHSENTTMLTTIVATIRDVLTQFWRDVLSIYYANTPTWRWLKSGALVFLGFFAWMSGAVLLSVEPAWSFLTYVMAYGFLLIAWGPLTHLVVVPLTIRLRRTAEHPAARWFSRNSGKVNLSIFFTLVIILGTVTPPIMMMEFSPEFSADSGEPFGGDLVCDDGTEVVSCEVNQPEGFDRIEITTGGETITTVDGPPFEFEIQRSKIEKTRTGREFTVLYYNDGEIANRQIHRV